MKTFGGAKKYVFIDQTQIDQAKTWLGQQQQTNGCYASVGPFLNNLMRVSTGERKKTKLKFSVLNNLHKLVITCFSYKHIVCVMLVNKSCVILPH